MVLPELGEKKPAQRGGQKVGNTDSSTVRGAPNSPSYRFTRRALVFRYYLLNIAGEAETATPLPNVLVVLRGAGCLPVSRRQSTDDSQCAKKTYQTGNAPPHRGIHHTKNLTSDETRFNALYGSTTYCNFYSHVKYSPLASSVRVIYVAFCCYTAPDIQPFFD